MTARSWPTAVVLSVASGIHLSESFADQHDLITELAGWPVMTHHLARPEVWEGCRDKIVAQVPWIAHAIENMPTFDTSDRELAQRQVVQYVTRIVVSCGPWVDLEPGEPLPRLPLLAGLENLGRGATS